MKKLKLSASDVQIAIAVAGKLESFLRTAIREELQRETVPLPRLGYSLKETAVILGVSYASVYRLNQRGELKCSNALRHKIVPRAEIVRFLSRAL